MSPDEHDEGFEEAIEDLEAPAMMQADVAGGANACITPTCLNEKTSLKTWCQDVSCASKPPSETACTNASSYIILKAL
jgi:hypothetical protein